MASMANKHGFKNIRTGNQSLSHIPTWTARAAKWNRDTMELAARPGLQPVTEGERKRLTFALTNEALWHSFTSDPPKGRTLTVGDFKQLQKATVDNRALQLVATGPDCLLRRIWYQLPPTQYDAQTKVGPVSEILLSYC